MIWIILLFCLVSFLPLIIEFTLFTLSVLLDVEGFDDRES